MSQELPHNAPFRKTKVTASSLATIDVFQGLGHEALEEIAGFCQGRSYSPGVEVISYMDESDDVFFIVSGKVQVTIYSLSGKVITFQDLDAGSMFGEIAAIDGRPRTTGIQTVSPAFLVLMPATYFKQVLWQHRSMGDRVLNRLTSLIRLLCERVVEFHALPVAQRIRTEVLRLACAQATSGNMVSLDPAPTHSDIASRAGTHREAVTRELKAMDHDGLVSRKNGALVIEDLAELKRTVDAVLGTRSVNGNLGQANSIR